MLMHPDYNTDSELSTAPEPAPSCIPPEGYSVTVPPELRHPEILLLWPQDNMANLIEDENNAPHFKLLYYDL